MLKQNKRTTIKRFQINFQLMSKTYKDFTKFLNFGPKIFGLWTGTGTFGLKIL